MYCSDCLFFSDLGICKNPLSKRNDVGYFQKACNLISIREEKSSEEKNEEPAMSKDETKVCADCGRELPVDSFQKTRSGGRASRCKECVAKRRWAKDATPKEESPGEAGEQKPVKRRNYLHYVTDDALVAELKRRGYAGQITKTSSFEL